MEVAVALWVAVWLVLGAWTGVEVWRLSDLTRTVADSGESLSDVGQGLQSFEPVPLVGEEAARIGTRVSDNGVDIVAGAEQARGSFRRLAVLLGVTIAFVPTVPVVVMHRVLRRLPAQQA